MKAILEKCDQVELEFLSKILSSVFTDKEQMEHQLDLSKNSESAKSALLSEIEKKHDITVQLTLPIGGVSLLKRAILESHSEK